MTAGMLDLTDGAPRRTGRPPTPPGVPEGGYQAVANLLNQVFDWEGTGHRPMYRQQVQAWHLHGTLNRLGQLPPSPVRVRRPDKAVHTHPRAVFDTGPDSPWIDWAAAGVPANAGGGYGRTKRWAVPRRKEG